MLLQNAKYIAHGTATITAILDTSATSVAPGSTDTIGFVADTSVRDRTTTAAEILLNCNPLVVRTSNYC